MAATDLTWLLVLACCVSFPTGGSTCPAGCQSCKDDQLWCPGAGLTQLPEDIPEDTLVIDLSQNEISQLQRRQVPSRPSVQSLRLSGNLISTLKSATFENMPSLMSLDLAHNQIRTISDNAFRGLTELRTISLDNNQLVQIGGMFNSTPMVSSIRLGSNRITSLEKDDFKENAMIKMLDLSNNKISAIHGDTFKPLKMLQYLVLSNNPVTSLSDLTFSSTMLSLADFSNCHLTSVPRTMPPSLQDFRLGNNRIERIEQDDFQNITRLRLLIMNDNLISHVAHRSFHQLENLREIWLTRNDLVYIPRGLPSNLQKLYMDYNQVVELEPMLFPAESQLKYLTLESNKVKKVHQESLKKVTKLEELNLQTNDITLLDTGTFTTVPALKTLKLSDNPLQTIEAGTFADMDSLTTLMMSYIDHPVTPGVQILKENFLTHMPKLTHVDMTNSPYLVRRLFDMLDTPQLARLSSIIYINLQYNALQTLPEKVKDAFPNVKDIILDGNLWKCDQRLTWLHDWMSSASDVSFFSMEEPTCEYPQSLQGRSLSSLDSSEFVEESAEADTQDKAPAEEPAEGSTEPEEPDETERESQQQETDASTATTGVQPADEEGTQGLPPLPPRTQPDADTSSPVESQRYGTMGTRVVIKPPRSNQVATSESEAETNADATPSKTSADKKAKKKDRKNKDKKNKKDRQRRKKNKRNKERRRKRRLAAGKSPKRGKRCKIQSDGSMKCRKRKDRKRTKKMKTTSPVV